MSTAISYQKAMKKSLLTSKELERLACAALCSANEVKFNWQLCAEEFGSTKGSFQTMFQTTLKKLRDGGCFVGGDDGDNEDCEPTTPMPKKTPKGRKRKNIENGEESTPTTGRKRGAKKAKIVVEEAGNDNLLDDELIVKTEVVDGEEDGQMEV